MLNGLRNKEAGINKNKHVFSASRFSTKVFYFILIIVPIPPSFPLLTCPLPCCVFRLLCFVCIKSCEISDLEDEILDRSWGGIFMCAEC